MKDDLPPIDPPDEEELRSAAALARALDGGRSEPDLPQAALETAALLRLSSGAARLDATRAAEIRRELLEGLRGAPGERTREPQAHPARQGAAPRRPRGFALPRWLFLTFPLAGAAALSLLVFMRNPESIRSGEPSATETRAMPSAAVTSAAPGASSAPGESSADAVRAVPGTPRDGLQAQEASRDVGTLDDGAHDDATGLGVASRADNEARSLAAADEKSEPVAAAKRSAESEPSIGASSDVESRARGRVAALAPPAASGPASSAGAAAEAAPVAAARTSASKLATAAPPAGMALHARDERTRQALVGLDRATAARRTALLARVNDAELSEAHAGLDAARRPEELERSQRALRRELDTLAADLDPTDARLVRQDIYCRLAETALRLGQPRVALDWTRRGLDLDGPPTPFLAQLMALEGDAWAALGDDSSAASSYMRALRVNEALLDENLDGR